MSVPTGSDPGEGESTGSSTADPDGFAPDLRPARASTLAVAGVVGFLTLVVAVATPSPVPTLLGATAAAALGLAVGLVQDERSSRVAGGAALGLAAMCLAVLAPWLQPGTAAITLAVEVAAFGGALATTDGDGAGEGGVTDAIGMFSYAVVALWLVSLAVAMLPAFVWGAQAAVETLIPANAGPDLFGFAVLLAVAVGSVRSALRGLPIVELAPGTDRERIDDLVSQTDDALTKALGVAGLGVVVGLVATVAIATVAIPPAVVALVAIPAGTPLLRGPLFAVAVLAGTVAVAIRLVRWTGGTVADRSRRGAAVGTGVAFALALAALHPAVIAVAEGLTSADFSNLGTHLAAVAVLFAADVLTVCGLLLLVLLPALTSVGVVPGRSGGRAVAAAGLVLTATAMATVAHPLVTLALAVGAMVAWDLGEFAVGVGEEVGRDVDTGRIQTVHAAGSVAVGVVGLVVAGVAYGAVQVLTVSGRVAVLALAASVVGTVALIAALRG